MKPLNRSFAVWIKKKFGLVSITDAANLYRQAVAALRAERAAMANAAEGWHKGGLDTFYPTDFPYSIRYLMVMLAPPGTAQPASIPYAISPSRLINLYPTSRISNNTAAIPLGIALDEPDNTSADPGPYTTGVQLLGGGQNRTQIGISDSVIPFNTHLVGSSTTAGQLTALPAVPGLYWSPGLAISTSEGASAQIEFDPRCLILGVGLVT